MVALTSQQVWEEIAAVNFAVIGMVNAQGHARTAGVVITTEGNKVLFASGRQAWKVRHIEANPNVSVTIPIHRRVPLLPMIKVPPATITFHGMARLIEPTAASPRVIKGLTGGLQLDPESARTMVFVAITPEGAFVTYGIGMRVDRMRDTQFARGRAPVGGEA